MEADIPVPNPAVTAILASAQMRSLIAQRGQAALAAYQSIVAKETGQLAESAHVAVYLANGRWQAKLIVDAPHAASHEFGTQHQLGAHDLNRVLDILGSL